MGFLADLQSEVNSRLPANPANPANRSHVPAKDSQNSQDSQWGEVEQQRARLLVLAADEGLPAGLVDELGDADVAVCVGLDGPALRTYLRVLDRDDGMARGVVPDGWDAVAHCEACGPIHWHAAERLKGCAWCKHRRALRAIPRPRVRCGDCAYFEPDRYSPAAGAGRCCVRDGAPSYWPGQAHRCRDMRPMEDKHGE